GGAGAVGAKYAMPHRPPSPAGLDPPAVADAPYPPVVRHGALVGDSQAGVVAARLTEHARRGGDALTVTMYGGCPPLLHVTILYNHKPLPKCSELYQGFNQAGFEFLILTAVWDLYVTPPPPDRDFVPLGLADPQTGRPAADPYALLAGGLTAMIADAKRAGVKRILVVGPFPRFPARPPNCVLRAIRLGVDRCSPSRASVDARLAKTIDTLRPVTAGAEGGRL